ncbi:hypothetical protein [Actinoplanes sp. OR16]|uniref:hypothetical protein n=1 Tax=Actinoplanes sp. OR16 TaxID=946334 RepID=UPI001E525557|nr:hypothetical protein [Actinoplanes sp. OR16]
MTSLVRLAEVLDVIEQQLTGSDDPEIAVVGRYGTDQVAGGPSPSGVRVRYSSGAEAYLWGAVWPGENPVPMPDELPGRARRAERLTVSVCRLLDAARPAALGSWQLVGLPDLGPVGERGKAPLGIRIVGADGTSVLLRATAAGAPMPED